MRPLKVVVGVALLILAIAAGIAVRMRPGPASQPMPATPTDRPAVSSTGPTTPSPLPSPSQRATPGATLLAERDSELDYAAFFERHRHRRDGASKILAAELLDRCIGYYPGGPGLARTLAGIAKLPPAIRDQARRAADELTRRCRGFTVAHFADRNLWVGLRRDALAIGDAAALAHHLDKPEVNKVHRLQDLMPRLASSADPMVLNEMASLYGAVPDLRWRFEGLATPLTRNEMLWAWKLAACDAGLNCGPSSIEMLSACSNGSGCGLAHLEDLLRAEIVGPAAFDRITTVRSAIATGIRSGHWPEGMWKPRADD